MQFPFFSKKHYHFLYTLLISKKTVGACVWHVENGKILVDGISDLLLWDDEQEESLFEAADKAIGSLGDIQATQVLLSLPDDWVQGQNIHPKRKGLLRSLTEQLELSSVGFVVTIEAVIAYMKEAAGQPLNAVCACVDPDAFIMGIITQSQSSPILRIGRSDRVTDDFLEGCSRLKASGVPPHMVLISLSESEAVLAHMKQELEGNVWDQTVFIQAPTVRLESPAFVLSAATQAGGKEVLKAMPELSEFEAAKDIPVPDFAPVPTDVAIVTEPVETAEVELDAHTDVQDRQDLEPRRRPYRLVILGIAIIGILAVTYFIFVPKLLRAQVTVQRKATALSGSATLTIFTDATSASGSGQLQGALIPLSANGEIQVPTTGQKKTGDPATGAVNIFNLTAAAKSFKSGTPLKSGKLAFETSEDVTVASASTGTNYEKIPGKATVKVKAIAAGEESNLGKNVELSIGGFDASAFVARSENPFTGGTSRTVPSVTAKDQETALSQLTATLQQKIEDNLHEKLESGQDGFVAGPITTSGKKFDKNVSDEATSLTLTMNASGSAFVYSRLDAIEAAASTLNISIPAGAKLDQSAITIERADGKKLSETSAQMNVTVSGNMTLPVDSAQFASILAGKSMEDARTFLDSQQAVEKYTLTLSPSVFTPFARTLPKSPEKIEVHIQE